MSIKKILEKALRKSGVILYNWRKFQTNLAKKRVEKDPRIEANRTYKAVFKKDINWNNPINIVEKIYWLQIYSDTSLWSICADKYAVRQFVQERGCGETLNELYGKWDDPYDIEWDKLPQSFVLKTNNGCGQIVIAKDKDLLNKDIIAKEFKRWMGVVYGYRGAQLHYTKIEPCVIAEKLLVNETNPGHAIVDYKIWCFHGVPDRILVISDRAKGEYNLCLYDTEWNNISYKLYSEVNRRADYNYGCDVPKPKSFEEMLEVAKKLSNGFPQVRVDLYEIDDKPVFGEMTFSSGYGRTTALKEYYNELGSKIDLTKVEKLSQPNNPLGF